MKMPWLLFILLDPASFASQGGSTTMTSNKSSFLVDWSIGQAINTPLIDKGSSMIISTGFLQNKNCDPCLYKTLDSFLLPLQIGPNPIEQFLQIKIKQAGLIWVGWDIYTTEGLLMQRSKTMLAGISIQYNIPFSQYPKGLYFIKLYFLVDGRYPITKIFQLYKL